MPTKKQIEDFFIDDKIAVIGAARDDKKFGAYLYRELKKEGFDVYPVNPNAETIQGDRCFQSVKDLPAEVKRALIVTPPSSTADVLKEVLETNIENIWIQRAADSPEALKIAEESGRNIISKHCIMMFIEPVRGVHALHRFFVKLFGGYPK